jgi:hypothetical protein
VGLELGFLQGGDHPMGVEGGVWSKNRGRRRGSDRASASGSSPPSSPNCKRQSEEIYKSLDSRRKSPADPLLSLGRFAGKKKKEREKDMG